MSRRLRPIAEPYVAAASRGVRVRARLFVSSYDHRVLLALGRHLGHLASADLAQRCRAGRLDARATAASRRTRKRALTAACSARWAGAITRTSEDAWQLSRRNLIAEGKSLRARITRIDRRLRVPVDSRRGRVRGYQTQAERFERQRRLQALRRRLERVEARLEGGRVSICRGGKALARTRHNLVAAGLDEGSFKARWDAARLFVCADGEAAKKWGNETIRWDPETGFVEIKLPVALAHLANRPHGRYRPSCAVAFSYRGDEVAAQAASGAVRYDISFNPQRKRWYLDASWTFPERTAPLLSELQCRPVLAVDLNPTHLAAVVVDPSGNPVSRPVSIPLELDGLRATTRDGRLREAISETITIATEAGCSAIVIEDLDFSDARDLGRERQGRGPFRGRRGRAFRATVSGIPTARFAKRLVQMTVNRGLRVIAIDPAYTSKWGAEHWLGAVKQLSPETSVHHAAALVIGRRGLGQRARRRERCDSTRPEDRRERATDSAVGATPVVAGLSEPRHTQPRTRKARGQPQRRRKTPRADRYPPGSEVVQDRSGPPVTSSSAHADGG